MCLLSFLKWGSIGNPLRIVQWDFTRRDHPGNPGRVSGSGPVNGYLYLIHKKSQALEVFKSFKAEVELQLGKKIKAFKSDRGGDYYGRYDGSGEQRLGPFAIFLKDCGIVS